MPPKARADIVGSLLRPEFLRESRRSARDGTGSLEALHEAEDEAVLEAIDLQEELELDVISDGEARRLAWAASFSMLDDPTYIPPFAGTSLVASYSPAGWGAFWRNDEGRELPPPAAGRRALITDWLHLQRDIVGDEYGFLQRHARTRTKYCFPAPSFHRTYWDPDQSRGAYATVEEFLFAVRDMIRREIIDRLVDLGCDYIQLDAPNYGQTYTDPAVRAAFEEQGHDLESELIFDAELDNSVFEGIVGVTRALHICRGNRSGGYWSASGGYETFGPAMFPRLTNVGTLLLEYDSPRAGNFTPLKDVRPGTMVVLGLLTTKSGILEEESDIERRVAEASRFIPLEDLALSTQCGFASGEAGNPLRPEEQAAKLALVSRLAHKIWPD